VSKSGTLRVNIVGDAGPLENTLKGAGGKIGGFAKTVGKVGAGAVVALGTAAVTSAFKTAAMGDEIAKTAPKLGVSTDQLQEMTYWAERNGLSSSDLERAVGRLNQRIGDGEAGSSKYVDALNGMGVATLDMNGNVRETGDVMADTVKALSDIESPAERSAAAAEIFGTKMGRELMPALQDGSLSMEEAAEMAHELGLVMSEDATKSAERFTDAWADIKDAGTGMLRDFGTPVMEFMAERLFPMIQDHVVPALREFADWVGPKLAVAAEWIGDFFDNVVMPAFESLSDWWQEDGPAIIAAAEALWDGLKGVFDAVSDAWDTLVGMFQSGGNDTNSVFAEVSAFAKEVWPQIQAIIESAMDAIQAVIRLVTEIVRRVWEAWGDDILKFAATIWESIKTVIQGTLQVIQGIWETFAGLFSGDWSRMWDGIKQIASGVWDVIGGLWDALLGAIELALTVAWDVISGLWEALWEWIKDKASEAWDNLKQSVSDGIDDVVGFFRDLPGNMVSALGNLGDILKGAGRQILGGLFDGFRERWETSKKWLSDLGGQIKNLKGPIEKDRVLLTDIGEEIIGGLGRGMDKEWSKVEKQLGTMTAEIPLAVGPGSFRAAGTAATSRSPADETNRLLRELLAEMRRGGDVFLDGDKVGASLVHGIRATQGGWR